MKIHMSSRGQNNWTNNHFLKMNLLATDERIKRGQRIKNKLPETGKRKRCKQRWGKMKKSLPFLRLMAICIWKHATKWTPFNVDGSNYYYAKWHELTRPFLMRGTWRWKCKDSDSTFLVVTTAIAMWYTFCLWFLKLRVWIPLFMRA